MSVQSLLIDGGGLFLILMTIVQISPLKFNPWSWFGRVINADINAKLEAHIKKDEQRTADAHRARILHFNNELLRDIPHTKEEFIEVLAEIDLYNEYCREHPDYPNNRAELAITNIKQTYLERLKKHDFLQEGTAKETAV